MNVKTNLIQAYNTALAQVVNNPWAGKAFGTDVYRGAQSIIIPRGGIDFGICKMGGSNGGLYLDDKFAYHLQSFYDAGAATFAYWYVDSSWYSEFTIDGVAKQENDNHPILQTILRGLRSGNTGWKAVRILFLDVESAGKGSAWNRTYVEDLRERIVNLQRTGGAPPKMLLGLYSSQNFMSTQPELSVWCEQHPEIVVWTANYLTAYPGKHMPIADYKTNSLPLTTRKPRWFGDNPAKPKQYKRFWQYHGTFNGAQYSTCPEILGGSMYSDGTFKPAGLDLNMFEGTRAELWAMLGVPDPLIVVEPPPVDPPPVVDPDLEELLARIETLEGNALNHEQRLSAVEQFRDNVKGA